MRSESSVIYNYIPLYKQLHCSIKSAHYNGYTPHIHNLDIPYCGFQVVSDNVSLATGCHHRVVEPRTVKALSVT